MSNPQKARDYELLVRRLLRTKLAGEGNHTAKIYHRKSYTGASGQSYEIDVSFETAVAETSIVILLECKCYKDKVGVDDVTEFAYKVHDIGAHKGIIVTTIGFESGAVTVAVREGLGLVTAMRAWRVMSPSMAGTPPPYIIYSDHQRIAFRYPKIRSILPFRTDSIPFLRYSSAPLGSDTDRWPSDSSLVGFKPAIEGFFGDPMTVLDAAVVFCVENDMNAGTLAKARGFMEPECS